MACSRVNFTFTFTSLYLGTTHKIQNCIREEVKNGLKSGNACYHSVQNLLSSGFLSENMKLKTYRTVILPRLCGCESWCLTLREQRRLRAFGNSVLKKIFGPKKDEVAG